MKESKLTVVGLADPVDVVGRLRKVGSAAIVSVGPATEEKKKDGDKKEGGGDKKDADKKGDDKKPPPPPVYPYPYPWHAYAAAAAAAQYQYHPRPYPPQYVVHSAEEDPNSCVIC
jgi:hypothetical protein